MGIIDKSEDLQKLVEEGFCIAIKGENALILSYVPYVDEHRNIRYGTLVDTALSLSNDQTRQPQTHTIQFAGSFPCDERGRPIDAIRHSELNVDLGPVTLNWNFSNKPDRGHYLDYYEKFSRYAEIISAPARAMDPAVNVRSGRIMESDGAGPFRYRDTASGRAGINLVSRKLRKIRVGIIGLGGTGSYVLDFVSKTHVEGIDIFDGDIYLQHNAFRAPGALSGEELSDAGLKAEHYGNVYGKIRTDINVHPCFVTPENFRELDGLSFVFVCIDNGKARRQIVEYLLSKGIPFIDVGMGVTSNNDTLDGILRVTLGRDDILSNNKVPFEDMNGNDEYATNIQVAELNGLNAALAVVKWKKLFGFYADQALEQHSSYNVALNRSVNEDKKEAAANPASLH
jgi:hypothetical protein